MLSKIRVLILIAGTSLLGACGTTGNGAEPSGPASAVDAATGEPINSKCPIGGEAIDPEVTLDFAGAKIGLCCEGCRGDWDAMADADKTAWLDRVRSGN